VQQKIGKKSQKDVISYRLLKRCVNNMSKYKHLDEKNSTFDINVKRNKPSYIQPFRGRLAKVCFAYIQVSSNLKKANRTNSTFGFCRHESQRRKNQKSCFLPTL